MGRTVQRGTLPMDLVRDVDRPHLGRVWVWIPFIGHDAVCGSGLDDSRRAPLLTM